LTKAARWALGVSALAVLGAALVLTFVLSLSTSGWLAERHFIWLFWVNVAVAGLLLLVIGLGALRLATRLKRGKFGSRLLAKLAGVFALVGVVPGLLIYGVSYQFVTRSIDTWFDVQVAQALDAGLSLGRSTLDAAVADLTSQARTAAERLADARQLDARLPEGKQPIGPLALERTRQQLGVRDAVLLGPNGQVLASAGGSNAALVPERPAAALLRQARLQRSVGVLEGLDDEPQPGASPTARVRAVALVPNTDINLAAANEERFLMLVQPLPDALVANALAVQAAYREYQQRALARDGLRRMVVGTLTLSLVLSVFGALLLAVSLGNQIIRPLLLVADGVRQVAEGDLTAKPVFASRDELGGLTRSFAQMTEQLSDARAQVQRGVAQLEGARTRLQTILDSLSAGVIVFDRQGAIDTVNPGATRILRHPLSAYRGRPLSDVPGLAEFSAAVWQRSELHRTSPEDGERDHWQDAFELQLGPGHGPGGGETLNLLLRGASLPGDARLLVFDDITEVVSGQRSVAWAEVARRLAHEIKNPLTPIQLAVQEVARRGTHTERLAIFYLLLNIDAPLKTRILCMDEGNKEKIGRFLQDLRNELVTTYFCSSQSVPEFVKACTEAYWIA
jgi:nitrogen fixation/metabolism regulation signal transduction histidine kinase